MSTTANTTQQDITVYRGDDFSTELAFNDTNDCPINITGWTIFFTVKRRLEDPDSAAVIAINNTPTNPLCGRTLITVSNTITKAFNGPYFYDFRFINASGGVVTITSGTITFLDHATRRT